MNGTDNNGSIIVRSNRRRARRKCWEELGRRKESGVITVEEDEIGTTGAHAVRHL